MTFATILQNFEHSMAVLQSKDKLCNMAKVCRKNEEISAREFAYQWPLKTWKDEGLKCRLVLSIKFLLSLKFEGCVSKYVLKGFFH